MKKTLLTSILLIPIVALGYSLAFAQGEATLELKPSATQANAGDEFTVDIVLKNPEVQNVISVRSWLEYNTTALEAENIDSSKSLFTLSAPGEDEISSADGHVKIGRSNISGGVKDAETTVATVKFKVLTTNALSTDIKFYDYQVSELGHTSVNIIDSGFPVNILSEEPEKLTMSLNPGGAPAITPTPVPELTTTQTQTGFGGGSLISDTLLRPINLMANTGSGYVDLKWDAPDDPARAGFNIYYGKTSGQYSRRRTIGNYNNYRIDGLTNNETYYLAVTAFDQLNMESEYSNEVGIIVNQPLSSTNPFTSLLGQVLAKIPGQPQNGPLVGWLLFSAAGLSGAVLYGKRKKRIANENAITCPEHN